MTFSQAPVSQTGTRPFQTPDLLLFFVNSLLPLPDYFDMPMPADCIVELPGKRDALRRAYSQVTEREKTRLSRPDELVMELEPGAGSGAERAQDCLKQTLAEIKASRPARLFILDRDALALKTQNMLEPLEAALAKMDLHLSILKSR